MAGVPLNANPAHVVLFSDALGVLSSCGGKWVAVAGLAASIDIQGKFTIDYEDSAIKNGALGLTDANYTNWFWLNCKRIRFGDALMSTMTRVPRGKPRSERAYLAAAVIAHELWHWQNGSDEPGAWTEEREFWQALLHSVVSKNSKDTRVKCIAQMARGREDEGYRSGYYKGPRLFGEPFTPSIQPYTAPPLRYYK